MTLVCALKHILRPQKGNKKKISFAFPRPDVWYDIRAVLLHGIYVKSHVYVRYSHAATVSEIYVEHIDFI